MTSLLFFLVRDFHQGLELLVEPPLSAMVHTLGDHAHPAWGRAWARTSLPRLGGIKIVHFSPPKDSSTLASCLVGIEERPAQGGKQNLSWSNNRLPIPLSYELGFQAMALQQAR